jgi:alpha-2-macroglobulin
MKIKSFSGYSMVFILVLLSCFLLTSCKPKHKEILQGDPQFIPYIAAYTTGTISSASTIRIRLTEPSPSFAGENKPAAEKLFEFTPSLEGEAIWIDKQTVEFKPARLMTQDQLYTAKFLLGKVREVESAFREFDFGFHIMKQSFEVSGLGLIIENSARPDQYTYEGRLVTTDVLPPEKLKEIITAEYMGKNLDIAWTNDPRNRIFSFRINNISRADKAKTLLIAWNGKALGVDYSDQLEVPVPPIGFFGKLSHRVASTEERSLLIYFSDLLNPDQDLRGVVSTNRDDLVSFRIQGNILKIILSDYTDSEFNVTISAGLMNAAGKKLGEELKIYLAEKTFALLHPQLRATGNGSILPSSQGLIFPFEAVNLKSVKLTIVKIFESNIAQFLQENTLDGNSEMRRVGRPIFSRVIPLTNSGITDFSKWNRFTIDLNEFIKADPGAIYQVNISFGKRNILNACAATAGTEESLTETEQMQRLTDKFDGPEGYYYYDLYEEPYYEEGFDWRERENPCNPAYYTRDKMISRNILATDIGLLMKRGTSGDAMIAVTDIRSAAPMADVSLEVLDFQLQKLFETKSNSDGMATFRLERKPFLLIARYGEQRSYLRVDDGSSLSLSNFDISGNEVQKGLKGFIYGERGVWRPGDSLYLSFILQDKQEVLPVGHPVVFELKNPSGQLITRMVKPNDKMGLFTFITATTADAPTGKWTAVVKAGGSIFTKPIRIETVKPNRLKVNFQPDKTIPFGKTGTIHAKLHAQWLHGGVSGNLKASYEVVLVKAKAEFKSYGNFSFDDPGVSFSSETLPVFDDRLDANGNAAINTNLKLNKELPSALNAYFKGKVFEPGGDFSVDFLTEPILPYESYIGLRAEKPQKGYWLEANKDHVLYLASVNKAGQPVSMGNLKVEIFKQRWSWWWEEDDEGRAEFVSSNYDQPVATLSASTSGGKGSTKFRINYPAWGRFYIKVTNPATGQSCGQFVYIDWPYSYGRSDANVPGGATMLALSSDRNSCKVNESVKVTIPGMPGARALISLENGSKVIKAYWIDAGKTENVAEIKATTEMTPNIFIFVSVIQPHKNKKNDLPIRQYGVLSLDVEDPGTALTPLIRTADKLKPEQKVQLSVSEKNGKRMNYTIAVVDEGLLDLTHFKTPDPHGVFFAHEALGVKTFDLFDQVIGAFGSTLERLLSIGGDEVLKQEEKGKSLRFKPVVKFLGPFSLGEGKTANHSFIMPNYIGSVRMMVVASSKDSYGFAEKTIPVKQDVMVMATLPRVIRPNEEVVMPVNVFSMIKSARTVTVTVRTSGMISLTGSATRKVTFNGEEDKVIYFKMKSGNKTGMAKVDVTATGNTDKSSFHVDLPVLLPSLPVHRSTDYMIPAGKTQMIRETTFGYPGTNKADLELSQMGKVNFTERTRFLVDYPYGCAEQITSKAFAQLYLPRVVDLDKGLVSQSEFNIRAGISSVSRMQSTEGGFYYWPGASSSNDWITSFVGHFLVEAKKAGYSVPEDIIARWREYQRSIAKKWQPLSGNRYYQVNQAYRLYTLALSGTPDLSSMNRLKEEHELLPQAAWRLAAAYSLAGKQDVALKMVAGLPVQVKELRGWGMTFGSELRDRAMILETMTELGLLREATIQATEIAAVFNSQSWLSTQECCYSLLSLAKYYARFASPEPIQASYTVNGKETTLSTKKFSMNVPLKITETESNNLSITNKAKIPLFVRLNEWGIPMKDDDLSFRNELNMAVSFVTREGKPLDVKKLKQGTEFKVIVRVSSKNPFHSLRNIALRQIFPSGWEITDRTLNEPDQQNDALPYTYRDVRDDRVYTFFDLDEDKAKTFTVTLTATYSGRFYFPGAFCEPMYDNRVGAKDSGIWVEVVTE